MAGSFAELEKAFKEKVMATGVPEPDDISPSNTNMLKLLAMEYQATKGDVQGKPPQFVPDELWDEWRALKGMSKEAAMKMYLERADELSYFE